jgi:hypothetical protein
MNKHTVEMLGRLQALGFTADEALRLRRISMTLHRWNELECGTGDDRVTISVERDEQTGKPFFRRQWMGYNNQWQDVSRPYPDLEKGALRRLAKIMEAHPDLVSYHQTDPRGASLYILRQSDWPDRQNRLDSIYTRGIAVHD